MIPYTREQMQAIVDEIDKQTDRGAALIAASVIDGFLEHLIIARLVELSSKRKKALFGQPNGPLSTLSPKIELGFALGLFNEERRESLHLIRKVRNAFAHKMDPISFEDPDISAIVETGVTPKVKAYSTMSARTKFLFSFNVVTSFLAFTAYFPHIRINTLDNEPSYHKHFDEVSAALMHFILEWKVPNKNALEKRPSSEAMKLSLLQSSEAQRAVLEYHLGKISGPLQPDTHDCKHIYNDGVFELCKDREGQYQLLSIPPETGI
jgi:DNA-binding MltR family transcriptional regulator